MGMKIRLNYVHENHCPTVYCMIESALGRPLCQPIGKPDMVCLPQPMIKIQMTWASLQLPLHSSKTTSKCNEHQHEQIQTAHRLASRMSTCPKLDFTLHEDPFGDPEFCAGQDYVDDIREMYTKDWAASNRRRQQMAAALYFIDKLALRAGHEKDEDEADTVGCCTLKVLTRRWHTGVQPLGGLVPVTL